MRGPIETPPTPRSPPEPRAGHQPRQCAALLKRGAGAGRPGQGRGRHQPRQVRGPIETHVTLVDMSSPFADVTSRAKCAALLKPRTAGRAGRTGAAGGHQPRQVRGPIETASVMVGGGVVRDRVTSRAKCAALLKLHVSSYESTDWLWCHQPRQVRGPIETPSWRSFICASCLCHQPCQVRGPIETRRTQPCIVP